MAITAKITGFEGNSEFTDRNGVAREAHLITYINTGTNKTVEMKILSNNPVFKLLNKHPPKIGSVVDIGFEKVGNFNVINKFAKEGTLNMADDSKPSYTGNKKFTSNINPDRELSMEISGLMQAIIQKDGLSGLKNKVATAYAIKQELMKSAKEGTIAVSEAGHDFDDSRELETMTKKSEAKVAKFTIDEDDENPFGD